MKTTRPKSLLPDADVVIETYKLGVWEQLIAEIPVLVPATIAYCEALFYKGRKRSVSKEIHLPALVEQGKIRQVEASAQEVEAVLKRFDCISRESLHPGEVEALAVFYARKAPECAFCSGDKTAIRCLAMLGLSDCAISFGRGSRFDRAQEEFAGPVYEGVPSRTDKDRPAAKNHRFGAGCE